jgi:nucleoside-diphosphate kinase
MFSKLSHSWLNFMERSLIILKPDCTEKGVVGKVITRLERAGLKIAECKVMHLDEAILREHYAHIAHLPFFPEIIDFMSSRPVIAMVVEGNNAVARVRSLLGPTDSQQALPGTIRGDFGSDRMRNIAHASDSKETAEAETKRFFGN